MESPNKSGQHEYWQKYEASWDTRGRSNILNGEIQQCLDNMLLGERSPVGDATYRVVEHRITDNRIDLVLEVKNWCSVFEILSDIFAVTSCEIRKRFPQLFPQDVHSLWEGGYCRKIESAHDKKLSEMVVP